MGALARTWLAVAALWLLSPTVATAEHVAGLFDDCGQCHTARAWKVIRSDSGAIDHAKTGFRLVGRHAGVPCTTCHRPDRDLKTPWPGACVACHEDLVHRGAMGNDCARCHSDKSWRVPEGRAIHARTRFALTGPHLAADCGSCHRRADQAQYDDAPVECAGCHTDAYYRPGNVPDHVAMAISTQCELCHRVSTWKASRFNHSGFFPLTGAHAMPACVQCHVPGRFGGTPTTCDGCHRARWLTTTMPNHGASGFSTDCVQCHTTSGWHPARTEFHEAAFPITTGKHVNIPCIHCHPAQNAGNLALYTCITCHTLVNKQGVALGDQHKNVAGYMYDDRSCLNCHPHGTKR
jgi:hypothetical protein